MNTSLLKILRDTVVILGIICISCQNNPNHKEKKTIDGETNQITREKTDSRGNQGRKNVQISVIPRLANTPGNKMKRVYSLSNNLEVSINFGTDYIIEKKVDGHWVKDPSVDSLGFEDIMLSLDPDSSKEYPLIWKSINPGDYRIKKEVWPVDEKEKKITLIARFTIK